MAELQKNKMYNCLHFLLKALRPWMALEKIMISLASTFCQSRCEKDTPPPDRTSRTAIRGRKQKPKHQSLFCDQSRVIPDLLFIGQLNIMTFNTSESMFFFIYLVHWHDFNFQLQCLLLCSRYCSSSYVSSSAHVL